MEKSNITHMDSLVLYRIIGRIEGVRSIMSGNIISECNKRCLDILESICKNLETFVDERVEI